MARRNKRPKLSDLPAQADPSTELDSATFLLAVQPVLKQLESDLSARAKSSPTVTAALKARHAAEKSNKRTADNFAQWQQHFIDQVAAAWLLSCVFVRTLEDRGLLTHPRIAGPGASDSQKLFFALAPSLTERDYLLTIFRELTHFDAAQDLFDAKHNPVWLLAPSAEAVKALLALFRSPTADTPAFRFGQPDTRCLGDLYQDLNERVRKRYALLQTPRFVESFILDRTLERAIERFGLDDTTVIDPTCGSGHFLLGSFDRLYEHRLRAEPGLDPRQAAHKALDAVFGADINPYAVAIARFRLTLSFLEKAGFKKLADAPELPLHLVVADSLLHNPHLTQGAFADLEDQSIKEWKGQEFALEDEKAARDVLHRQYAAVVGNPPYITVKDEALRDRYRELYQSAFRTYSVAVPFTERFFQLGREGAYVGMITANSFMKREFGKKLIEEFLPTVNLDIIVNTSGAYIPGHGTPTVLLFGTAEEPQGQKVLAVLANRGEPTTPKDPAKGHVWHSIAEHWSDQGFENDYITVAHIELQSLAQHPWALSGGGASELKALLESRAGKTLGEIVESPIGRAARTGQDEVYMCPPHVGERLEFSDSWWMDLVVGEAVRDWALGKLDRMLFPYDRSRDLEPHRENDPDSQAPLRYLWPYRTLLSDRATFQGKMKDAGLHWYEYMQYTASANRTALSITFAAIATHNHFVLDRGGKVFKQSAPIIKLPEDATEDDHLALLAYLNSSTACFWMKQVFTPKGMHNASESNATPYLVRYDFDGSKLKKLPIPRSYGQRRDELLALGRALDELQRRRSEITFERLIDSVSTVEELESAFHGAIEQRTLLLRRGVALQEELDWLVYELFGLAKRGQALGPDDLDPVDLGARPFEIAVEPTSSSQGEKTYFDWHGTSASTQVPTTINARQRELYGARIERLRNEKQLRLVDGPDGKRRWMQPSGKAAQELETDEKVLHEQALEWLIDRAEVLVKNESTTFGIRNLAGRMAGDEKLTTVHQWLSGEESSLSALAQNVLQEHSVPFLAAWRYSDTGLSKWAEWLHTWDLQRKEDAGIGAGEVPVPPKYGQSDFREASYWKLRGKLDVPKERFISYPGCESDEDGEALYGWAGWNHLERTQALAALYQQRKKEGWLAAREPDADGEQDDRLIPMLAGLLELLPWVKQWHNEPNQDFDGLRLGDYFERFIKAECREWGLTEEDLESWSPPEKRGRRSRSRGAA